jgi:predicted transcriptional regulator
MSKVKLNLEVHQYMLEHQVKHGHPPTLQQIVLAVDTVNRRSSARHAVRRLMEAGLVVVESGKWSGTARRYRAVDGERGLYSKDSQP